MLIYLTWKLSPKETVQLEVSLSFKQILQLSTSLMMLSSSIAPSSFSGSALFAENEAAEGKGWEGEARGFVCVCDVLPGALCLFLSISEESMEKALYFHAMEFIHQTLLYSVSKVYLQVNSKNRCRNWSFLFQGLRKKSLHEKCVINLTLWKEKYLFL